MTFQEMFSQVKAMLSDVDVSAIADHLAYQFRITGEAEGVFYAEVKDRDAPCGALLLQRL